MRNTKTLIFDIQNLLFKSLVKIFKNTEVKVFKIIKQNPSNYILIQEVKEEAISTNVSKFTFKLKISTSFFEEEKLTKIINNLHQIYDILKHDIINIKITEISVSSPTALKGFEGEVVILIFAQ